MSTSRQPGQRRGTGRTSLACEPCRRRKSKCDGQRPICGTCQSHLLSCHYEPPRSTRRQKYWDRDYVQSLENQVKLLSESLERPQHPAPNDAPPGNESPPYGPRLLRALKDFSTMNWSSVTAKDGKPLIAGPGHCAISSDYVLPAFEDASISSLPQPALSTAAFAADIGPKIQLKQHLKARFLANINPYYKFVDPSWLNFSDLFLNNDTVLQFLYSVLFAAAAYSSPSATRDTAEAFMAYAEGLVQQCCFQHLCLPVLQALLVLAWYKHMTMDYTKGNMYHYMAIGLSMHLGVKETPQLEQTLNDVATIRTFWSLYFLDRAATPRLGCPSGIPWEINRVAPYIATIPVELIDIPALAFEYHCRLLLLQEQHVDAMYCASFKSLPASDKHAMFAAANSALLSFRKLIDRRLYLGRNVKPDKTQVVFWISYHSVLINLHRPFMDPDDPDTAHNIPAALRTTIAAAGAVTRLVRGLQASDELREVPPFVIYQVFRALLVNGLSLIANEEEGGQRTSGNFWVCLRALGEMNGVWKEFGDKTMPFVLALTKSWALDGETQPEVDDVTPLSPDVSDLVGEITTKSSSPDDGPDISIFM